MDATTRIPGEDLSPRSAGEGAAGEPFSDGVPEGVLRWSVPEGSEGRVLLVLLDKKRPGHGAEFLRGLRPADLSARILVVAVFDDPEALDGGAMALVVGGANCDPSRDLVVLDSPRPGLALGLDCTKKRADEGYDRGEWPRLIRQDPSIVARVDGYAGELPP